VTAAARLRWWGLASLLVHAAAWLGLVLGPGLVGRRLAEAPLEPAVVELVLGEGGETRLAERAEEASPPPAPPVAPQPEQRAEAPAEPPPAEPPPPPEEPEETAPPLPPPPPPQPTPEPAPQPRIELPPSPPVRAGGPAAVRLGDPGKPPHGDLLDPEDKRFRKATADSGNMMPAYPLEAGLRMEAGMVKLQLYVDTSGRVANVILLRSSGSAALDRAAREQALTWRFTPARRDGKAVPDIVEIEIEFRLI
jgi:protein TonB